MRRTGSFLFMLFFFCVLFYGGAAMPLASQEEGDSGDSYEEEDVDWATYMPPLYTKGDKTFTITLGVLFPLYFAGDTIADKRINLNMGGTGSLSYHYFLGPNLFIGGEIGGMFASTRGRNMLFIVPMGFSVGYQFLIRRIEIPLTLMVGVAPETYLDENFIGPVLKPGVSVFWRFNPDWSFGLNGKWWFIPQWWTNNDKDAIGNFFELTVSARFHF